MYIYVVSINRYKYLYSYVRVYLRVTDTYILAISEIYLILSHLIAFNFLNINKYIIRTIFLLYLIDIKFFFSLYKINNHNFI